MDNDGNEQDGACDSNKSESQSSTSPRVKPVHINIHKNPNYDQTNNESKNWPGPVYAPIRHDFHNSNGYKHQNHPHFSFPKTPQMLVISKSNISDN